MALNILALCLFAICCYGWGSLAYVLLYPRQNLLHAYIIALGLVVLTFIGGILNAIQLASSLPLAVCAYGGILLAIFFAARNMQTTDRRSEVLFSKLPLWAYVVVTTGLAVFLTATLLPTLVFNIHDDFLTYLPRIVRMRQTGSLGGNPFEQFGLSDFGLQAFFQALLATWVSLDCAFAFDAIFCFILGLWLIIEIGSNNRCTTVAIFLAMIVYAIIHPQIVNISAVYSIAVLVLALLVATKNLLDKLEKRVPLSHLALASVPVGGIIASLVAIKLTSTFFLLPFCGIILIYVLTTYTKRGGVAALIAAVSALAVIAGWTLTHADKFYALSRELPDIPLDPALTIYPSIKSAFRRPPSNYGGTRLDYTIALLALLISLIASTSRLLRHSRDSASLLNVAAIVGGIVAYLGIAGVVDDQNALRYSIPFLIALVPATVIFHDSILTFSRDRYLTGLWQRGFAVATISCIGMLLIVFAKYGAQRVVRLVREHTIVSFPLNNKELVALESAALSDREQSNLRNMQSRLPAGTTIFAWVDAPFQFDFVRNRIFHFCHDWFAAPWRPRVRTPQEFVEDLVAQNVDYILWQYQTVFGLPLPYLQTQLKGREWVEYRIIHQNTLDLLLTLRALATPNNVIFDDGRTVLISLKRAAASLSPSSSYTVTMKLAWRVRSRRWKL